MDTTSPLLALEGENARTIGLKSARGHRVDILTGVERRRSWTVEQKRSIVGESLGPQLTPTEVARKYWPVATASQPDIQWLAAR